MSPIFHVTSREQWMHAQSEGSYQGDTLDTEGFIHGSTSTQLGGVLQRFFKGRTDLILLEIDPAKLEPSLKFEPATDAYELFPHIYGALNVGAVVAATPIDADGSPIKV